MVNPHLLADFISPFLLAGLTSFVVTLIVITIYRRFGWLDDPTKTRLAKTTHTYPVPRGGGIPIAIAVALTIILYLGIDKHTIAILTAVFLLAVTGVADDLKDVNPYLRLAIGLIAALFIIASGISIAFITNPFGGIIHLDQPRLILNFLGSSHQFWLLANLIALLWIVWTMNMVNWAKGLDGQLPGIVIIAALTIALLSLRFTEDVTQWSVISLAALTAGAYAGFLPWNIYPQKIMPGYGAGSIAGFLLAIISILSRAKPATMIIVLGIPTLDAIYTVARRLAAGKSPVWGDRGHLHHKLLDSGFSKRQVAFFYWLVTAILGFIALYLNSRQKLFTIVLLTVLVGGLLIWLNYFLSSSKPPGRANG